jgi:hypothetical protein
MLSFFVSKTYFFPCIIYCVSNTVTNMNGKDHLFLKVICDKSDGK